MGNTDFLARRFEDNRRRLHSVAFHLLGSAADADDAVQSAWLKASGADFATVDNLSGWLTTITARVAMDQLRARSRRAEQSLSDSPELDNAPAVAAPDADEELASRARARLQAGPAEQPRHRTEHLAVVSAFLAASRGGDIPALLALLAPDVVRRVDSVLVPAGVPTEMRGAGDVATETRRFTRRARAGAVLLIDGAPGIAIAPGGHLLAVLRIGIGDDERIHTIDIAGAPDRLRTATLQLPGS